MENRKAICIRQLELTTKQRRLGGFNNRDWSVHSSEGWKSEQGEGMVRCR